MTLLTFLCIFVSLWFSCFFAGFPIMLFLVLPEHVLFSPSLWCFFEAFRLLLCIWAFWFTWCCRKKGSFGNYSECCIFHVNILNNNNTFYVAHTEEPNSQRDFTRKSPLHSDKTWRVYSALAPPPGTTLDRAIISRASTVWKVVPFLRLVPRSSKNNSKISVHSMCLCTSVLIDGTL